LEGQHAISAAEMSEEPDNNKVPDEFLREEIGCCPEEGMLRQAQYDEIHQ
jgi:hypothetical protein